jgi:glyoxylase-like metal-dependent hydrolase (beta-lactamase superfamily II)
MADNLQWQIGDVTVTRVVESVANIPAAGLLPSASDDVLASHASWLRPHFVDDDGNLVLSIHAFGITVGDRKIIVDTCIGNDRQIPGMEALNKKTPFLGDLADAGFPREEVDTVICTHLHFDHVGGNLAEGAAAFPSARYVIAGDEWGYWSTNEADDQYASVDASVRPLVDAGLVDLVDPDHVLTDEVRLVSTPGHTPGHVSVEILSGGESAVVTGDLAHHPIEFVAPQWTMSADVDGAQCSDTRRRFAERYGDGRTLVLGTHFGGTSAGRFDASAQTWTPA